jgi:hypothetical protein
MHCVLDRDLHLLFHFARHPLVVVIEQSDPSPSRFIYSKISCCGCPFLLRQLDKKHIRRRKASDRSSRRRIGPIRDDYDLHGSVGLV